MIFMFRRQNTDRSGNSFSESKKRAVWNKAEIIQGIDPSVRRKDRCGAWIDWDQYGNTIDKGKGWEIDHILPVALGGGDDLGNLQPLQWQNNRKKGDNYPTRDYCIITASKRSI